MQKLRTFFRTFTRSLLDPTYYQDILRAPFAFSLKYFVLLTFLSSVITAAVVMLPFTRIDIADVSEQLVSGFPEDVEVTVENGKTSINKPLPYQVPLPGELYLVRDHLQMDVESLVIFDTNQNVPSAEAFLDRKVFVLVTEDTVYAQDNPQTGAVGVYKIPQDSNSTVNRSVLQEWQQRLVSSPLIKYNLYLPLLTLGALVLTFLFLFIARLLTAVVFSLVTFLLLLLLKKYLVNNMQYSFMKIWQVSLHSLTLVMVLAYLADLIQLGHHFMLWRYFIVYLFWTVFLLNRVSESSKAPMAVSSAPKSTEEKKVIQSSLTSSKKTATRKSQKTSVTKKARKNKKG